MSLLFVSSSALLGISPFVTRFLTFDPEGGFPFF